jgi:NAD(P)-dependent dehydrogenase (short-subunit alcohol dehydrogenase family)
VWKGRGCANDDARRDLSRRIVSVVGEAAMVFDLSGKVALVTGAGQGVGAGISRMLAAQGATVVVNDLRGERAAETAKSIEAAGGRAEVSEFDVTDRAAVTNAVGDIATRLAPVDILVNNAGNGGEEGLHPAPFREMDPASWMGPIAVNLFGVLHCCHATIDAMCEKGWGRVITIASGAGMVGLGIGVSTYAAGKGGAIGFMRHLAIETARYGVTANSLALGLMASNARSELTAGMARAIPVGRLGTPEDIGALCVYLASNEASWMTGQTVHINGGSVTS